jgi:hypothetical protein
MNNAHFVPPPFYGIPTDSTHNSPFLLHPSNLQQDVKLETERPEIIQRLTSVASSPPSWTQFYGQPQQQSTQQQQNEHQADSSSSSNGDQSTLNSGGLVPDCLPQMTDEESICSEDLEAFAKVKFER